MDLWLSNYPLVCFGSDKEAGRTIENGVVQLSDVFILWHDHKVADCNVPRPSEHEQNGFGYL